MPPESWSGGPETSGAPKAVRSDVCRLNPVDNQGPRFVGCMAAWYTATGPDEQGIGDLHRDNYAHVPTPV